MSKRRIAAVDWIQYVGLRLVSMGLHCFGVNRNLQTAKLLGSFMYAADRRHRERALANLQRSFPEMTASQREKLARRSMQQLVMLFVEVLFTTRLIHLNTWRRYIELDSFKEALSLLLKKDQGLILLTGHYGNWEILGYVLATLGFETTSIARSLDNPYVNQWLLDVRQRKGQRIVDKRGATGEITAILESGGTVGFIADQNAGSKGIFVDFFGRKASTYKSIGLLAMEYNVPIVIGYARRRDDQFSFHCGAQDIIYPHDWQDEADPLRYITQRYTRAIEDIVRQDPGQYLWVHRRWKSRPKGEAPQPHD